VSVDRLLAECGDSYPGIENIVSVYSDGRLQRRSRIATDFQTDTLAVTFDGLLQNTPFIHDLKALLDLLRDKLGQPVDIEFAVSGGNIYLLQCRAQSSAGDQRPMPIPDDVERDDVLFRARKHVTNGGSRTSRTWSTSCPRPTPRCRAPRRSRRCQGRRPPQRPAAQAAVRPLRPRALGSRGDVRLGVPVTYSEINNCAMLVEVARRDGNYVPDLSFGTHFFQTWWRLRSATCPLPRRARQHLQRAADHRCRKPPAAPAARAGGLERVIRVVDVGRIAGGRCCGWP